MDNFELQKFNIPGLPSLFTLPVTCASWWQDQVDRLLHRNTGYDPRIQDNQAPGGICDPGKLHTSFLASPAAMDSTMRERLTHWDLN